MERKDCSITQLECTKENFFDYWVLFTQPFHQLQDKEMKMLAHILKKRYELSKSISDEEILDNHLFSTITKQDMAQGLNISIENFLVKLSKFRKKGIIVDNKINQRLIPDLSNNPKMFNFSVNFSIN